MCILLKGRPPSIPAREPPRLVIGTHACDLGVAPDPILEGNRRARRQSSRSGASSTPLRPRGREPIPFVGPAGRILEQALGSAAIDRERVFVTNVVKHFRWRPAPGSRRRLHETPDRRHVAACLPWVEAELELVRPSLRWLDEILSSAHHPLSLELDPKLAELERGDLLDILATAPDGHLPADPATGLGSQVRYGR